MLRLHTTVRPKRDFPLEFPKTTSSHTPALYAQVRANGRVQDYFRYGLGGSEMFSASFPLQKVFNVPAVAGWTLQLQRWPRDVAIRRGMISSVWMDLLHLVASREAEVLDADGGGVPAREFLRLINEDESDAVIPGASVRWALVINDADCLAVQLQSLPASAATLNGKPALKKVSYFPFLSNL